MISTKCHFGLFCQETYYETKQEPEINLGFEFNFTGTAGLIVSLKIFAFRVKIVHNSQCVLLGVLVWQYTSCQTNLCRGSHQTWSQTTVSSQNISLFCDETDLQTADENKRLCLFPSGLHQRVPQGTWGTHQEIHATTDRESGDRMGIISSGEESMVATHQPPVTVAIAVNQTWLSSICKIIKTEASLSLKLVLGFIQMPVFFPHLHLQIASNRKDRRLNFHRFSSDVTIHQEYALRSSHSSTEKEGKSSHN